MTIAEFFNLTPAQVARASAALNAGITNFQKTMQPVINLVVELARSPEVQRSVERYQELAKKLATYFEPHRAALSKLTLDPEWVAMIEGAAKMATEPYVPMINVPQRRIEDDEPVEVRPHRRTGFRLPGVNDDE